MTRIAAIKQAINDNDLSITVEEPQTLYGTETMLIEVSVVRRPKKTKK